MGRKLPRALYLMLQRYFRHNVGIQSAALAFYLLFMIFPFLIFISALLGLLDLNVTAILLALGEIGLAGEVRPVGLAQQRVGEAYRLGFTTFILPKSSLRTIDQSQYPGAVFHGVSSIGEAFTGLRMGRR